MPIFIENNKNFPLQAKYNEYNCLVVVFIWLLAERGSA